MQAGMRLLRDDGIDKVLAGITTPAEAGPSDGVHAITSHARWAAALHLRRSATALLCNFTISLSAFTSIAARKL
jgi:hypothetical protein